MLLNFVSVGSAPMYVLFGFCNVNYIELKFCMTCSIVSSCLCCFQVFEMASFELKQVYRFPPHGRNFCNVVLCSYKCM